MDIHAEYLGSSIHEISSELVADPRSSSGDDGNLVVEAPYPSAHASILGHPRWPCIAPGDRRRTDVLGQIARAQMLFDPPMPVPGWRVAVTGRVGVTTAHVMNLHE